MTTTILREIPSYGYSIWTATIDYLDWTLMVTVDQRTDKAFVVEGQCDEYEAACDIARWWGLNWKRGEGTPTTDREFVEHGR